MRALRIVLRFVRWLFRSSHGLWPPAPGPPLSAARTCLDLLEPTRTYLDPRREQCRGGSRALLPCHSRIPPDQRFEGGARDLDAANGAGGIPLGPSGPDKQKLCNLTQARR